MLMWNKIRKYYKKHPFIYAFVLNALLVLIFYIFNVPYNQTNDDTGMAAIAANAYGSYSTHLVFENFIYGYILNFFYKLFPIINWYSIFELLLTLGSFTVIFGVYFKLVTKRVHRIVGVLILVSLVKDFYLILQFTKVASVCAIAGYILSFYYLNHNYDIKYYSISILFLLMSCFFRYKCFFIATVFAGIYGFVFILIPNIKGRKEFFVKLKRYFIYFPLMFILMFVFIVADKIYYQSNEEWAKYTEFNRLRADLLDYGWIEPFPSYEDNKDAYDELGINANDVEFYSMGCLSDEQNLTMEKLNDLKDLKNEITYKNFNLFQACKSFIKSISDAPLILLLLILFVDYIVEYRLDNNSLYSIFILLGYFAFYMYMFMLNRIVNWLLVSITLMALISLLMIYPKMERKQNFYKKEWVFVICCLCFLVLTFDKMTYNQLKNDRYKVTKLYEYMENNKEEILVADRNVFRWNYKYFSAFKHIGENFYTHQVDLGGWLSRTPFMHKIMKDNDISNIYTALYENDNVFFYTSANDLLLLQYIHDHYNENVSMSIVKQFDGIKLIKYSTYQKKGDKRKEKFRVEKIITDTIYENYNEVQVSVPMENIRNIKDIYLNVIDSENKQSYMAYNNYFSLGDRTFISFFISKEVFEKNNFNECELLLIIDNQNSYLKKEA